MDIQNQKPTGMNCPGCKQFIPISINQLLRDKEINCPYCDLILNIDQGQSKKALSALSKINTAKENVEKASKFEGL